MTFLNHKAVEYIQMLISQPLCCGIKSERTELYVFRFGCVANAPNLHGESVTSIYNLHILCGFKIIRKIGKKSIKEYSSNSLPSIFKNDINHLIGLTVKRVKLSDKNDLWIDFGDYWMVFVTNEDGEESWRFFSSCENSPHLVASDKWVRF